MTVVQYPGPVQCSLSVAYREGNDVERGECVDLFLALGLGAPCHGARPVTGSAPLVDLPVVVCITAEVELNAVECHCEPNIDPPPHAPTHVATPERPAIVAVACREVLQQETCVDS